MKRLIAAVAAAAALSACATTNDVGGGTLSHSAFNMAPSRPATSPVPARFGYHIEGGEGWSGAITHAVEDGDPRIDFVLQPGAAEIHAGLDFGDGYARDGVRRYEGEAADGARVAIALQAGLCEVDGAAYGYFADIAVGGNAWSGCARETGVSDRWSNYLAAYLPAIDLCLAELGPQARHVTLAYPHGDGTAVRMVDRDGSRWECVTRAGDARLGSLRALDAAETAPDEGDPIFVRGRTPRAGEGCYVYETVQTRSGEAIGAFGYDACQTPGPAIG